MPEARSEARAFSCAVLRSAQVDVPDVLWQQPARALSTRAPRGHGPEPGWEQLMGASGLLSSGAVFRLAGLKPGERP